MKRKNFFLRSAGFNVFAYLWLRVGLLRMPVAVAASAMNSGGFPFRSSAGAAFGRFSAASAMNAGEFPLRGTKSAAFGRFPAASAMNAGEFPFRGTKSAAFGRFSAASAMNSGGFPFRGTEETAFGRFPAVSAMAGRFCRVHGRRRICGMGRIAEIQRCSSYGERGYRGEGCFRFSRRTSVMRGAVHLASVRCASHMGQHT